MHRNCCARQRVFAAMAAKHRETDARSARLRGRSLVSSLGLVLLSVVRLLPTAEAADNVVGGWHSPKKNNWPLIPIHAALTPDGRVLTYGTDGAGTTTTGYFIYDVWDPSAGLSKGHITLENHDPDRHFLQRAGDPAGQRSDLHRRRHQLAKIDHERSEHEGQQQYESLPLFGRHADARPEYEAPALVCIDHGAAKRQSVRPGRPGRR